MHKLELQNKQSPPITITVLTHLPNPFSFSFLGLLSRDFCRMKWKKERKVNNSTLYCVNHKRLFTTPPEPEGFSADKTTTT